MSERKPKFAKKSLGQNFLVDKAAIAKIVGAVPEKTPLLLEIGPGRGALSTELHTRAEKFCVLEKDDVFAGHIGATLTIHGAKNQHVFHADALNFDWSRLWSETNSPTGTPLTVAANLPYNVATEILFRLLGMSEKIPLMVLMFQKEVGLRLAAKPGGKEYGGVTVLTQNLYEVKLQQILKPGAFRPSPKVDSAVLELSRRNAPIVTLKTEEERRRFSLLVRASFAHRRKTLENSLTLESGKLPWAGSSREFVRERLTKAGVEGKRRAETVSVAEFGEILRCFEAN